MAYSCQLKVGILGYGNLRTMSTYFEAPLLTENLNPLQRPGTGQKTTYGFIKACIATGKNSEKQGFGYSWLSKKIPDTQAKTC